MNTAQILDDMDRKARDICHRAGVGIVKHEINGKTILCKTKWNRGTSGKLFTTIWYVDGVRTARAKVAV